MNISFDKVSEVQGLLTLNLEKADYADKVTSALKSYQKKANMPGFRPGKVPMSLIQKMAGSSIKADEINKIIQEKVFGYIKENEIDMLGEPLPNDEKEDISKDIEADDLTFCFDIAVAPKFDATLSQSDTIPFYEIQVTDEMVDGQVKNYSQQNGSYKSVSEYADNDMVKGLLQEVDAEGNPVEGGMEVMDAVLMPHYFSNDEQKALFEGVKSTGRVVFNPAKAYGEDKVKFASLLNKKKDEVDGITQDFSISIEEITRFEGAVLNQELFDKVFGEGQVKSEGEFREKVAALLAQSFVPDSNYKFLLDAKEYMMNKVGELQYADDVLKRIMLANSKDKDMAKIEEEYEQSKKELTWHLIKEQIIKNNGIKIEEADLTVMAREATKAQFAQYGMMNIPDELLDNYAKEMLKKKDMVDSLVNRAVESKITVALLSQVTRDMKKVSVEDFNKMFN